MKKSNFINPFILLLISLSQSIKGARRLINKGVLNINLPRGRDDWCREKCESLIACEALFGDDHIALSLKIGYSVLEGPGEHLFRGKLFGSTVTRQSFRTQFVLDIAYALEISPCMVYVTDVSPSAPYNVQKNETLTWDADNVFVAFKMFNATVYHLKELTRQVQELESRVYEGEITRAIDLTHGVVVPTWDFSLKLMYQIEIIGNEAVKLIDSALILNQGAQRLCEGSSSQKQGATMDLLKPYCEFESYFRHDLAKALAVEIRNIDVLFIKAVEEGAVVVSFRLIPVLRQQLLVSLWMKEREEHLISLLQDHDSMLYRGNVTFRVDPTWGLKGSSSTLRADSRRLNRSVRSSPTNIYHRCKDTQRCSRGWNRYNISRSKSTSTMQRFAGGKHENIAIFMDFEDWRQGSIGWKDVCGAGNCQQVPSKPKVVHWSPFDFVSLAPSIPSYNTSINSGLVLNSARKLKDEAKQKEWINHISQYINWLRWESNISSLDAEIRSREDILSSFHHTLNDFELLLAKEVQKLSVMSSSQCTSQPCYLLFNTSDLLLSGGINATGTIGHNPDGTEVAIWTFDSIDLGPEVQVELTGQRSLVLLSKSTIMIDTHFKAVHGTLGGFPGGYSTYREKDFRFISVCDHENEKRRYRWKCRGDHSLSKSIKNTKSNNVNGPGSPSVRYYSFIIQSSAKIVHEIKAIKTDAKQGQRLGGGFFLHFEGYTSSFIRHDTTAYEMKEILEDTLNPAKVDMLELIDRSNVIPGVGSLRVSRFPNGYSGGFEWRITFLSAIGDIGEVDSGPLSITNLLSGIDSSAKIETIRNGNTIGGTFSLNFLGNKTRNLEHDVSGQEMKLALTKDIPGVISASVSRSGSHPNCNDGLCKNGPDQAGGYTWAISVVTNIENLSAFSPTSSEFDTVGEISKLEVENNLTGCISSICPNISISTQTHTPFSLSYGGGGGSFGGIGGVGFGPIPQKEVYGDEFLINLHGGSGGALGLTNPDEFYMIGLPAKVRGGSGGGSIALIASNDIVLGSNSSISCNGERGWGSFMAAGGGGSGGSILLSAGGVVKVDGLLEAKGGEGGVPTQEKAKSRGGAGGGGRIAIYGQSSIIQEFNVSGGICPDENAAVAKENCGGMDGSFFKSDANDQKYSIDTNTGAMETENSLHFHSFRPFELKLGREEHDRFSGPIFKLQDSAKPERVSFFVKVSCKDDAPLRNWEALLSLIPPTLTDDMSASFGFSVGSVMKHGLVTNGGLYRVENTHFMHAFYTKTKFDYWYKLDIQLDWIAMKYSIHLDDEAVVEDSSFNLTSIGSISISMRPSNVDVWFDEIFVGNDATMGFRCPALIRGSALEVPFIGERDWKASEVGAMENTLHKMSMHESHLSRRDISSGFNKGEINYFDGQGHPAFTSEIKSLPHENHFNSRYMRLGDLLKIDHADGPLHIWYGEHQIKVEGDDANGFIGGVGACSTTDMKSWKNEGILLHNVNITDMVRGSAGPFHIEKPKVLYNAKTKKYVMWMIVDNANRSLALAGVASSDYASGPFTFVRSFYPDGNRTRDQTLHQETDGSAYLIRTYYDTIEYLLPSPIMQPIWESVKNDDGSTNFPLTYHRAHYEKGYDNYHDIYLQRWRGEDKPWKVLCIDRVTNTEREIPYGAKGDEQCTGPFEYKHVIGQGDPSFEVTKEGVKSRFLDPNAPSNNVWKPNSVPEEKAQPWKVNYEAGTCGIRAADNDFTRYDPQLKDQVPTDRSDCSNIADNPTHPTLPDQLNGRPHIVQKRRAKFVAVSQLTSDYLDTTGALNTFEGELEDGADLSFIVNRAKESNSFGWNPGGDIDSTFTPHMYHPSFKSSMTKDSKFHQYESEYNDKALYSLQCVIDGNCNP